MLATEDRSSVISSEQPQQAVWTNDMSQ